MKKDSTKGKQRSIVQYEMLEECIRMKAQEFIQEVFEGEVNDFLGRGKSDRIKPGIDKSRGYRNGYGKDRKLALMNGTVTIRKVRKLALMNGTVTIRRPRVRNTEERFESMILPYFKRKSKELGDILPELYLHGLSSGDFELALRGLLGKGAPLSASSIQRLKAKWQLEYEQWQSRNLSELEVVYCWADGIYVKAGLEKDKAALLVIIGALKSGEKVLLACESGYRESKESWKEVLRSLRDRGLEFPKLTVADGHLGIWSALGELHPEGDEQRCWNHKIRNVLNAMPKRLRAEASELLKSVPYANTRKQCEKLRDKFINRYKDDYTKATNKLLSDWERMVTFYKYPKEHWVHIRTTNIVESPFSSVRLRTNASKRFKKVQSASAMIWKLLTVAEKSFRRLKGHWLLTDVLEGKPIKGE